MLKSDLTDLDFVSNYPNRKWKVIYLLYDLHRSVGCRRSDASVHSAVAIRMIGAHTINNAPLLQANYLSGLVNL